MRIHYRLTRRGLCGKCCVEEMAVLFVLKRADHLPDLGFLDVLIRLKCHIQQRFCLDECEECKCASFHIVCICWLNICDAKIVLPKGQIFDGKLASCVSSCIRVLSRILSVCVPPSFCSSSWASASASGNLRKLSTWVFLILKDTPCRRLYIVFRRASPLFLYSCSTQITPLYLYLVLCFFFLQSGHLNRKFDNGKLGISLFKRRPLIK